MTSLRWSWVNYLERASEVRVDLNQQPPPPPPPMIFGQPPWASEQGAWNLNQQPPPPPVVRRTVILKQKRTVDIGSHEHLLTMIFCPASLAGRDIRSTPSLSSSSPKKHSKAIPLCLSKSKGIPLLPRRYSVNPPQQLLLQSKHEVHLPLLLQHLPPDHSFSRMQSPILLWYITNSKVCCVGFDWGFVLFVCCSDLSYMKTFTTMSELNLICVSVNREARSPCTLRVRLANRAIVNPHTPLLPSLFFQKKSARRVLMRIHLSYSASLEVAWIVIHWKKPSQQCHNNAINKASNAILDSVLNADIKRPLLFQCIYKKTSPFSVTLLEDGSDLF